MNCKILIFDATELGEMLVVSVSADVGVVFICYSLQLWYSVGIYFQFGTK